MLFSFLILLREGFEITLILAIVLGYLKRTGNTHLFAQVWFGAGAAVAISVVAGAIFELTTANLAGATKEALEGFTMLFAVIVLTWMVFWMKRQAASIGRDLRHQVDIAVAGGSLIALVMLAFSAVLREGLETVLLLFAGASAQRGDTGPFLAGAFAGGAIACGLGYAVYRGSRAIPMRQFFTVSGIIVIIIAAGLLSNGIGALQASGLFHLGSRPWDTDSTLAQTTTLGKFLHTLVGYDSAPTWGQIVLYWGFLVGGLSAFLFGIGTPSARPSTSSTEPVAQG
jgi:high-affinity iron transporter